MKTILLLFVALTVAWGCGTSDSSPPNPVPDAGEQDTPTAVVDTSDDGGATADTGAPDTDPGGVDVGPAPEIVLPEVCGVTACGGVIEGRYAFRSACPVIGPPPEGWCPDAISVTTYHPSGELTFDTGGEYQIEALIYVRDEVWFPESCRPLDECRRSDILEDGYCRVQGSDHEYRLSFEGPALVEDTWLGMVAGDGTALEIPFCVDEGGLTLLGGTFDGRDDVAVYLERLP